MIREVEGNGEIFNQKSDQEDSQNADTSISLIWKILIITLKFLRNNNIF